ncbi:MAG TPA: flavin reductase family protein [Bacteroidota bacterium]|nr:flavin reductase family protein [Bacteroidota bacterium]
MSNAEAYPGSIFSLTDHELYVVSTRAEGRDYGQIATWIMPATLVPDAPRVVAVLSPMNHTHRFIAASGRFAISMLDEEQHELVPRFGLLSGRDVDKFEGVEIGRSPSGLPVLVGACGWAECVIVASLDAGDRMLYLADVVTQQVYPGRRPLRKQAAFALQPPDIRARLEEKHRLDGERDSALLRRFTHSAG